MSTRVTKYFTRCDLNVSYLQRVSSLKVWKKENSNVTAGAAYELYAYIRISECVSCRKKGKHSLSILLWRIPLSLRHQHFFAAGFHQNGNMESAGDAFGWRAPRMSCQGDAIAREHVNKRARTHTTKRDEPPAPAVCTLCVEKTRVLCRGRN